jgi:hypothetical protein
MLRPMHRLAVAAAALGVGITAAPAPARADVTVEYETPAVFVDTIDAAGIPRVYFDAQVIDGLGKLTPTAKTTQTANGTAWAEASDDVFVVGAIGTAGSAHAHAYHHLIVRDGQARPWVKVSLGSKIGFNPDSGFKASASTSPSPGQGVVRQAGFQIMVYTTEPTGTVTIKDDGTVVNETFPVPGTTGQAFLAAGWVQSYWGAPDTYGDPPVLRNKWSKYALIPDGEVLDYAEGDGLVVTFETRPTLLVRPNLPYLVRILVSADANSAAVVDPLVTAHPDNPDITIEFPNSVRNENPEPIMREVTPAALVALGIDPQPFVDMGFFPPAPGATPTAVATPLPTGSSAPSPAPTALPAPTTKCDAAGADAAAIAVTRARVDLACPCAAFDGTKGHKHGDYVQCATATVKAAVAAGELKKTCQGAVKACAAKSTCGKPGAVTCQRTTARNKTTCAIKNDALSCTAPKGGSACVGSATSCCDGCAAE